MRKLLVLLPVLFLIRFSVFGAGIVRPEQFGARGNGVSDDAPAFNKCLEVGGTIVLTAGKRYLIKTRLNAIRADVFALSGGGASLVIDASYPMSATYDHIFRFDNGSRRRQAFIMEDLSVVFLPGQKFSDRFKTGDTFFISIDNCNYVSIERVTFTAETYYNNLTFYSTFGTGNLNIKSCNIKLNTLSKQGGCVWVMNQYFENSSITIKDCVFEQDTWDETACFSASNLNGVRSSKISATVKNCVFISPCKSPSSGYIMAYNHFEYPADIKVKFKGCKFIASGGNARKIMSYQVGSKRDFNYAHLKTDFVGCEFDYRCSKDVDTGLLSLPFISSTSPEEYLFRFRRCSFTIRNIHPLIGDRDGDKSGCYEFRNCSYDSNAELFAKKYNLNSSNIFVTQNRKKKKLVYEDTHMQ